MKSNIISKIVGCLAILFLSVAFCSCDDDANDWGTDSSHDGLFRPLTFESTVKNSTNIWISFSKVIGAKKYVFEFSNDSLEFNNIIRTVEVMADTVTPSVTSETASKIKYLKSFPDFDAESSYSVRMKGIDTDSNLSSEYVQLFIKTPAENILLKPLVSAEDATLRWMPTDRVTRIEVKNMATGEVILDAALTEEEKAAAEKYVSGLKMGTSYVANIYNEDRLRGSMQFKTTGTAGSEAYIVQVGDDLEAILAEFVANEIYNVTLVFESESVHDLLTVAVPAGMHSLTFTAPSSGTLPKLNLNKVSNSSIMDGLYFENVYLNGETKESNRIVDTEIEIQDIRFDGCIMTNYNSIVRLRNTEMNVNKVEMTNCRVGNTGGYGIFNVGGANVTFNELVVSNCSFFEMGTQLTDIRTNINSVNVSNCTFYNHENPVKHIFRFDGNNLPNSVQISDCIFAGDNDGVEIKSTYGNYQALGLSFAGSYKTSELQEHKTYILTDVSVYEKTAYDLFEDPDGGIFYINAGAGFEGIGVAGDSRWFR